MLLWYIPNSSKPTSLLKLYQPWPSKILYTILPSAARYQSSRRKRKNSGKTYPGRRIFRPQSGYFAIICCIMWHRCLQQCVKFWKHSFKKKTQWQSVATTNQYTRKVEYEYRINAEQIHKNYTKRNTSLANFGMDIFLIHKFYITRNLESFKCQNLEQDKNPNSLPTSA